jgi:hypothetical protein
VVPNPLVPVPEAIPAAAWIFHLLDVALFAVHLLLMNILVGGMTIVLAGRLRGGSGPGNFGDAILGKLPTFFAWTVTMGIAPLLFLQVIYGHLFYTSSVLMGGYWLMVIPGLIVAYYAVYVQTRSTRQGVAIAAGSAALLVLLYVAFTYVNNMTLMVHPEHWSGYFVNRTGTILNTADPTIIPRYLHYVTGAVAVASLVMAFIWSVRAKAGAPDRDRNIRLGLRLFAYVTIAQAVVGGWFLFAIPGAQLKPLVASFGLGSITLGLGILAATGAVVSAFRGKLRPTIIQAGVTFVAMVLTRDHLRSLYLAGVSDPSELPVNPQYGIMALFLFILVIGLAAVAWMLKVGYRAPAGGGAQ